MEERRPRRWVRRLKRLLLFSVGGLLVLFLSLQIALSTPWMRNRVASKLSQRSGLDIKIGGLGWTPWSGGSVRGLIVEQPRGIREFSTEPLAQAACIRVFPDYWACLRKEWHASRIEIDEPELAVSLEMLVSIAASSVPAAEPPLVAMTDVPPPPSQVPLPSPPGGGSTGVDVDSEEIAKPQPPAPAAPEAVKAASKRPMDIVLRNGGFELFSIRSTGPLALVQGVELRLPLWTDGASGGCQIQRILVAEHSIETNVEVDVLMAADVIHWVVKNCSEKIEQITGRGLFRLVAGVPFQAAVGYRSETGLHLNVPGCGVGHIASNQTMVQGGGWALVPMSWRGLLQLQGEGVKLEEQGLEFTRYGASALLQNGVLQVPDARLLGDQFAVLGNGWVNRESGSGVVRLVVPGEAAEVLKNRLGVAQLEVLAPGNRQYLDVSFWRDPEGWMAELGGKPVPFEELWSE